MKKIIFLLAALFFLLLGGYYSIVYFLPFELISSPSSTIFLDTHGHALGETIYSGSIRHQDITYEEIPDFYKESLIALEDRTFYTNNGISLRGIIRSILHNIEAGKVVEGGTTLSSGLIRNILSIRENRTTRRKVLEFLSALRLNHLFSKEQILTEYINRVDFGYMNYGLKSAAKYYFNREPMHLTKAEQIALLILPKDSKKYDPYNKPKNFLSRFHRVVTLLAKEHILTSEEQKAILSEHLNWNREHLNAFPYVADFLKVKSGDFEGTTDIQTTFDGEFTEQIDAISKQTLSELAWRHVGDYGIIIAERTGERNPLLRVMIGGSNYAETSAGQVNATLALRQPGSTIKPFTYALAFEKLSFTPETTILDLPIAYKTSENYAYEPKNYSISYKGEITLRQALSESVNVAAIKLTEQIGVKTLLEFLRSLGITSLNKDADHYGLGLTLGNGEVSLFELLQAYTIFTNKGAYCPFIVFSEEGEKSCTPKIDAKYTDMVTSILSDRYAKIGDFPLNSSLDFGDRHVAVKTGTSRNFRDNWAIGFTDNYMIGVWTGNKSGENMKGVTGATGAGEIFRRIVYTLEKKEQVQSPLSRQMNGQSYLTITNPLEGSLYKQEPGKGTNKQQIHLDFKTNKDYDTVYWTLDTARVSGDFLDLIPGYHTLEIFLLKDGEVIGKDATHFQVE